MLLWDAKHSGGPWLLLAPVIHSKGQLSWRESVKSEKPLVALTWFSLLGLELFSES